MESRRTFLTASAAAIAATTATSAFGANDKIQMAIIGTGNRGGRVFDSLSRHDDCKFLAAAEVNQRARLTQWMTPGPARHFKLDTVGDYRKNSGPQGHRCGAHRHPRFLAQPGIMVDAIAAGKDVYVEKPAIQQRAPHQRNEWDAYVQG